MPSHDHSNFKGAFFPQLLSPKNFREMDYISHFYQQLHLVSQTFYQAARMTAAIKAPPSAAFLF